MKSKKLAERDLERDSVANRERIGREKLKQRRSIRQEEKE